MHKITNMSNPLETSLQCSLKGFYTMHYIEYAKNKIKRELRRPKEEIFLNAFKIQQNNAHCKDL